MACTLKNPAVKQGFLTWVRGWALWEGMGGPKSPEFGCIVMCACIFLEKESLNFVWTSKHLWHPLWEGNKRARKAALSDWGLLLMPLQKWKTDEKPVPEEEKPQANGTFPTKCLLPRGLFSRLCDSQQLGQPPFSSAPSGDGNTTFRAGQFWRLNEIMPVELLRLVQNKHVHNVNYCACCPWMVTVPQRVLSPLYLSSALWVCVCF